MTDTNLRGLAFDRLRGARRRLARLWRSKDGLSAVEFALSAPLFLGVLVPIADIGIAFSEQIQVQMAAQAGAQYAQSHGFNSSGISNTVAGSTALDSVSASPAPAQSCGCATGTDIAAATCGNPCPNGEQAGSYVVVSALHPYTPVLPYSILGTSTTLAAQATVRIQ